MFSSHNFRFPSMVGAILAATLMTVVSTLPDAVHAQGVDASRCVEKVPHDFRPTLL